jgi:hypothetical protein
MQSVEHKRLFATVQEGCSVQNALVWFARNRSQALKKAPCRIDIANRFNKKHCDTEGGGGTVELRSSDDDEPLSKMTRTMNARLQRGDFG